MGDSIMSYNGAAIIAMVGKDCVGIASDTRYGVRYLTAATDFHKVFEINQKCFVGLAGLATDVQTLIEKFRFRMNMYALKENRDIKPKTFAHLVSNVLYEKRFGPFFAEPVVAGLDENDKPFICAMDLIGAACFADDFVVNGTNTESLYGICETLYRPDMEEDQLFETLSQCLLSGVDRDALAGWGATVHIITPTHVTTKSLKGRQD